MFNTDVIAMAQPNTLNTQRIVKLELQSLIFLISLQFLVHFHFSPISRIFGGEVTPWHLGDKVAPEKRTVD
jgi:hypothetical protein